MFRAQSMQMSMWSHGIALSTFYLTCPLFSLSTSVCICLCLHLCITVIYLSISLEVTGSVFLSVLFSFNFSFDTSFLLKPLSFLISWILFFNSHFSFKVEKDALFYIHCFISDKQCDHSQLRNLLHFNFFPCKRG